MIAPFPMSDDLKTPFVDGLLAAIHMNRYQTNWPVLLAALRRLWETGKVSQFKTPYYEPLGKVKRPPE